MNSKTDKGRFIPLEVTLTSRATGFRCGLPTGFTLVEILVAVTIIVGIVSMVYGSYFATSKSAQACKAKMSLSQQGRKVLEQMARHIRCSYVPAAKKYAYSVTPNSKQRKQIPEDEINYFKGNPDEPTGEILHFITMNGIFTGRNSSDGLFEVAYKFDKSRGVLSFSQRRFVGTAKSIAEKRNWQPIARNIECIELDFFDGKQWLNNWDFKDKGKLPSAVKINIICEDENYRQCHCSTVAYVFCQNNQGKESRRDALVSVNKQ